jgi:cytochrome c oxidase assembly protein subunit 15
MIMLGGATRLTHSGLSIVEWKPITGIIPPLSHGQWLVEFDKYKQFPEYNLVNQGMSLSSFQFIYLMEYTHRLLGRLIGLWFLIPLAIFWIRGNLTTMLKKRASLALFLGLSQGILGWFMVKSGLVKDPSVSHYRLTAHLALAIAVYGLLFWTALQLMAAQFKSESQESPVIQKLCLISCIFISVTILYGGLVAGLKAGLIYNTFPLMEGQFIPGEWAFYKPVWLNFFENAAMVQWTHRWVAISTFALILFTSWKIRSLSNNQHVRAFAFYFALVGSIQATLGILTLLLQVPVSLGTLHQGTAIILLSLGLYLYFISRNHSETSNLDLGIGQELV